MNPTKEPSHKPTSSNHRFMYPNLHPSIPALSARFEKGLLQAIATLNRSLHRFPIMLRMLLLLLPLGLLERGCSVWMAGEGEAGNIGWGGDRLSRFQGGELRENGGGVGMVLVWTGIVPCGGHSDYRVDKGTNVEVGVAGGGGAVSLLFFSFLLFSFSFRVILSTPHCFRCYSSAHLLIVHVSCMLVLQWSSSDKKANPPTQSPQMSICVARSFSEFLPSLKTSSCSVSFLFLLSSAILRDNPPLEREQGLRVNVVATNGLSRFQTVLRALADL